MVKSEQVKITVYFRKVKKIFGRSKVTAGKHVQEQGASHLLFQKQMSKAKQARENSAGRANAAQGSGLSWTLIEEAGMYHRWSVPSPHLVLHSLETSVSMWTLRGWGKWGRSFLGPFSPSSHTELSIPQVLHMFSAEMTVFTKAACFSTAHCWGGKGGERKRLLGGRDVYRLQGRQHYVGAGILSFRLEGLRLSLFHENWRSGGFRVILPSTKAGKTIGCEA